MNDMTLSCLYYYKTLFPLQLTGKYAAHKVIQMDGHFI